MNTEHNNDWESISEPNDDIIGSTSTGMVRVQTKHGVETLTEDEWQQRYKERHEEWVKHQIELNPSNKYWVVCQYSKMWLPRAAFLPENHELIPKIKLLRDFAENYDYIIQKWIKTGPNILTSDGYYVNDVHCNSENNNDIYNIITDLASYVHCLDHIYEVDIDDGSMFYYMNDINASLTQKELYQALFEMQVHYDVPVNVVGCIVLSDCPLKDKSKIMLRFFCNESDKDIVYNKLMQDSRIVNVTTTNANGKSCYGFMQVDTKGTYNVFNNNIVEINGLTILFQ